MQHHILDQQSRLSDSPASSANLPIRSQQHLPNTTDHMQHFNHNSNHNPNCSFNRILDYNFDHSLPDYSFNHSLSYNFNRSFDHIVVRLVDSYRNSNRLRGSCNRSFDFGYFVAGRLAFFLIRKKSFN